MTKQWTRADVASASISQARARYRRLCAREAVARKTKDDHKLAEVTEELAVMIEAADEFGMDLVG